jgi:hypothetical protein
MPHEATKLVLGRGEVYFDRFLPNTRVGEGERYLGNTLSFRLQRDLQTLARSTAYKGRKVAAPPAVISESHSIDFVTDNVEVENIAAWFGAEVETPTLSGLLLTETFVVKKGRFYQLGRSQNVIGTRNVVVAQVRIGATVIARASNYAVDNDRGRLEILVGAPAIADGSTISVDFQILGSANSRVVSKAEMLYGSLRFVAFNESPLGQRHHIDYYMPFVSIAPKGQVDLKGDEWQQWAFEGVAMNLNPSVRQVYVARTPGSTVGLSDQQAIIDEFGTLSSFPFWDNELQVSVNEDWPPALDI